MRFCVPSLLLLACAPFAMSCTADVSSGEGAAIVDQTTFDFTVVRDRDLFDLKDLAYFGTVGPYAIYEVTGPAPSLEGPRVRLDSRAGGLSMLCGAAGYFTGGLDGDRVTMTLYGGDAGDEELTRTAVEAIVVDDGCADADDRYGERVPSDEPTGSATLASTAAESLRIDIEGDLPIGSRILLRLVAVDLPMEEHNNANTVPSICCDGEYCTLAE